MNNSFAEKMFSMYKVAHLSFDTFISNKKAINCLVYGTADKLP